MPREVSKMTTPQTLLVGCSFTDPSWQHEIPWSIEYSKTHPSYIVAKAGMGITGICTEALYYLKTLTGIQRLIIILPTLWRMDIEMDEETYLCNCMVDLLEANGDWSVKTSGKRKWIVSGGLNFSKKTESGKIFDLLYKHQGFLVMAKEHFRSLTMLIDYCKMHSIDYYISAIQDPLDQLDGVDYIRNDILKLLDEVEYSTWFRFNDKFIDQYLKHSNHPTTQEHQDLCRHIINFLTRK